MKRVLGIFVLFALVAACAPAAEPPPPGATYQGTREQVFNEVVRVISGSGWVISNSDQVGGFISAETTRVDPGFLYLSPTRVTERISLIVTAEGEERTDVVYQGTPEGVPLLHEIEAALEQRFGRVN